MTNLDLSANLIFVPSEPSQYYWKTSTIQEDGGWDVGEDRFLWLHSKNGLGFQRGDAKRFCLVDIEECVETQNESQAAPNVEYLSNSRADSSPLIISCKKIFRLSWWRTFISIYNAY